MGGDDTAKVAIVVDALLFLGQVPGPVLVEVAVAGHGAEFEDGFGAVQAPAGTGDVEAVLDQVAAWSLPPQGDSEGPEPSSSTQHRFQKIYLHRSPSTRVAHLGWEDRTC